MKRKYLLILLFLNVSTTLYSQQYRTFNGGVTFESKGLEELIAASSHQASCQIILNEGKGIFIIPVNSFKFNNGLMQEHFNENYMESAIYPRAQYRFEIIDIKQVNPDTNELQNVTTTGVLTLKNISKKVHIPGSIRFEGSKIILKSTFSIRLADYEIKIPKLLGKKIAEYVTINVDAQLTK